MAGKYTYRLTSEGFAEIEAQFKKLGDDGAAAFDKIKATMPGLGDAAERAQQRAAAAAKRLEDQARASFQSLQAGLDPAIAAQQKLAQGIETVATAQKLGVAGDVEAAAALQQLQRQYQSGSAGVSLFASGLNSLKGALGALGIAATVASLAGFAKSVFDSLVKLDDQAKSLGISTDALQAYHAAAIMAGSGADVADAGIQRFTRSIGEAAEQMGPARKAFMDLHLTASDLAGGTEAALPKAAAALLSIGDASQRARLEVALFGKAGQDVERVLEQLADPNLINKMKDAGLVAGADVIKRAHDMDVAWSTAWLHIKATTIDMIDAFGKLDAAAANGKVAGFLNVDPRVRGTGTVHEVPAEFHFTAAPGGTTAADAQQQWKGVNKEFDDFIAKQRLSIELAGLDAQKRAIAEAEIEGAAAKLKDQGKENEVVLDSMQKVLSILGAQGVQIVENTEKTKAFALAAAAAFAAAGITTPAASVGAIPTDVRSAIAARLKQATPVQFGFSDTGSPLFAKGAEEASHWNDKLLASMIEETKQATLAAAQEGIKAGTAKTEYEIRQNVRALKEDEYLAEQVRLASILPEQRAAELYILQQEVVLNQKLSADDKERIRDQFELIRQAQQLTDRIEEFRNTTRDGLKNLFLNGKIDAKSFLDSLREGWAETLADMAERALLQPIEIPLVLAMQQSASDLANLLGFGNGQGGASLTGANAGPSIFGMMQTGASIAGNAPSQAQQGGFIGGYGTLGKVINQPLYGVGGLFGGSGTPSDSTLGTALGGGLQGYGIGSLYGSIAGLSPAKAQNASIGGALGGLAGSFFGPIGTLVGSALGSFVGGLFGPGPSNFTATAKFNAGQTSATFSGDKPNQQTSDASKAAAQAIVAEIANLKGYGVSFNDTISQINIGQRDKSSFTLGSGATGTTASVGDVNDLAVGALQALLKSASSSSPTLQGVLGRNKFGSVEELDAAVKFVTQIYDATVAAKPAATETETAMKNLVQSFKDASVQAKSLGLDVAAFAAGAKKSFDQDIRGAILQIQDPLKYALELWQRDAQARLDAAAQLGGDIDQVKQLNALLYAQAQQQASSGVANGLTGFIQSLNYGAGSANAPDKQFFAALQDYNAARGTALASNAPGDIQSFIAAAQNFLPIARGFLGTSERYGAYADQAKGTAADFLQSFSSPSTPMPDLQPMIQAQQATTQATNAQTTAVVDAVASNTSRLDAITQQLSNMNGLLGALARRIPK